MRVGILTASDKGSQGKREDISAAVIRTIMENIGAAIEYYVLVPDEKANISSQLIYMCDTLKLSLILTTGGTGFSPRDVTPEATLEVIERQVPGIPEAMRYKSLQITPRAMLSRAISGIRGRTLIINLPGSPKAVRECLECVLEVLPHALEILCGSGGECAKS